MQPGPPESDTSATMDMYRIRGGKTPSSLLPFLLSARLSSPLVELCTDIGLRPPHPWLALTFFIFLLGREKHASLELTVPSMVVEPTKSGLGVIEYYEALSSTYRVRVDQIGK